MVTLTELPDGHWLYQDVADDGSDVFTMRLRPNVGKREARTMEQMGAIVERL